MVQLAALQLRPSTFDPVGVLQTHQQLQRGDQESQLTALRMQEMQEQMRDSRERRGALAGFRSQGGMASPTALNALSGHPELYTQAQGAMEARRQASAAENAREAHALMTSTVENSPQRAEGYRGALDRALQNGRIDADTHAMYTNREPTNLVLSDIIRRAQGVPTAAEMNRQEVGQQIMERFGFRQPSATAQAAAPRSPTPEPQDMPGISIDRSGTGPPSMPATAPALPATGAAPAAAAPPSQPGAGLSPEAAMIARLPLHQQRAFQVMLMEGVAKGDYTEIAKFLNDLEKEHKAPTNFEWVDQNDRSRGVRPIAGGPGTHLPSDVAGRMALLDTAARQLPQVRGVFERAWSAGDFARNFAAGGADTTGRRDIPVLSGDVGIARSNVRVAVEGILRAVSGAAAPDAEVERFTNMFTPGATDSVASAKSKLDRLDEFTQRYRQAITQGRTVTIQEIAEEYRDPAGSTASPTGGGANVRTYNPVTGKLE